MPTGERTAGYYVNWDEERERSVRELRRAAGAGWAEWLGRGMADAGKEGAFSSNGLSVVGGRRWDLFVTLTYDRRRFRRRFLQSGPGRTRERVVVPTMARAEQDVRELLRAAERALGRTVFAVLFGERHKDGWPHWHGMVDVGGLGPHDIELIGRLWFERFGYNRIEQPWDLNDVAGYCAKYVTKGFETVVLSDSLGGQQQVFRAEPGVVKRKRRRRRRRAAVGGLVSV